jgi:hypothetical protein
MTNTDDFFRDVPGLAAVLAMGRNAAGAKRAY